MTAKKNEDVTSGRIVKAKSPSFAVVAAVNDDEILANNLAASPMISESGIPLIVKHRQKSAALGYNAALDMTSADIVIFAHQDVYFPRGWERKLISAIELLEKDGSNWAVLGVVGRDAVGNLIGRSWSNGLNYEINTHFSNPMPVRSIDELVIVLRKDTSVTFDSNLPGFHIYGVDIVQSALKAGFEAYVFNGPVIHNSLPVVKLDSSYSKAYRYMQKKWRGNLPIYTTIMPIKRFSWMLVRFRLLSVRDRFLKAGSIRQRLESPSALAKELGYESFEGDEVQTN